MANPNHDTVEWDKKERATNAAVRTNEDVITKNSADVRSIQLPMNGDAVSIPIPMQVMTEPAMNSLSVYNGARTISEESMAEFTNIKSINGAM